MLTCPFCGAPETDRIDVEGRRCLVFACMFSPVVDPSLGEAALAAHLAATFPAERGGAYFRATCDRLHYFMTAGPGGKALLGDAAGDPPASPAPPA